MQNKYQTLVPYFAWLAAAAFVFFQFFLQSASTIMSEPWVVDYGLDEIELSNLSSAFFYSYIPMQIPAGILYDKFNTRKILFISAVTLSISCILFGCIHNYELSVIARFFMGLGAASGFVGLLKIIQDQFPMNRFALMFGIAESIGMIGVAAGLVLLAWFLNFYSWRSAMILCGIFAGILAIAIKLFVQDSNTVAKSSQMSFKIVFSQLKSVLTNKQVIICSIYGFFIVSILNCFTSLWGDAFLSNAYDFSPETTSSLLSIVFIGLSIGSPFNGWFVKRFGRHKPLLIWEAALSMLLIAALILVPGIPLYALYSLFFLIGLFCSAYGPCYALVNEAVETDIQATAIATANMIIVSSAPVLQLVVGGILESRSFGYATTDLQNFRIALSILPIGYFIAVIAGFFLKPGIDYSLEANAKGVIVNR